MSESFDWAMSMSENQARRLYCDGIMSQDMFDRWITARFYLHPVDGRYGHVEIGCENARCTHRGM